MPNDAWVERENRSSNSPILQKLPDTAYLCVDPSFQRYTILRRSSETKTNCTVSVEVFDMGSKRSIEKLDGKFMNAVSLSPMKSVCSTEGRRILWGAIVSDHHEKGGLFELNEAHDVRAVAMTPDGLLGGIAHGGSASSNASAGFVSIWDLNTGSKRCSINIGDNEIRDISISADGKSLAVAGHRGAPTVWDIANQKQLRYFPNLMSSIGGHINTVALSSDGLLMACGGSCGEILLVDTVSGQVRKTFIADFEEVNSLALTPDGRTIAAWDWRNQIFCAWTIETGIRIGKFRGTPSYGHIQLSRDGQKAALGNFIYNLRAPISESEHSPVLVAMAESGSFALLGLGDGSVVRVKCDSPDKKVIFQRASSEGPEILFLGLSRDETKAIVAYRDNQIYHIDLQTTEFRVIVLRPEWRQLSLEKSHPLPEPYPICRGALTPDAKFMITASDYEAIRVWSVSDGKCIYSHSLANLEFFNQGKIACMKVLPDSSGIVFTKFDESLFLWRFTDKKGPTTLRSHSKNEFPWSPVAVSPDGSLVARVSSGITIPLEIISIQTGAIRKSEEGRRADFVEWFHKDFLILSINTDDGESGLEIWDVRSLKLVTTHWLPSGLKEFSASPSSDRFVCITEDGQTHWLRFHPEKAEMQDASIL